MTTTEIEHHLWGAWSLTEEQAYKPICGKSTERNMFRELGPSYTLSKLWKKSRLPKPNNT